MKINLPLTDATYTYTLSYDAAPAEGCAYDYCGNTNLNVSTSTLGDGGLILPAHSGQEVSYTESDVSFSWSIQALAGEFSIAGYRLYTSAGTIDGTGAGPLTQDSVVSGEEVEAEVGGGVSIPDIDTAKAEYTTTELNNNQVNPKFTGGALVISTAEDPIATDFTVDANGGTIQADADTEISGVLGDDSSAIGSSGSLTKTGSSTLTLSGINTFTGDMVVDVGKLVVDGSLSGSVVVNTNGVLNGSGTVAGITSSGTIAPGNSPGTLTSTSSVVMTSGSTLQEEIDGLIFNPAGGAGSYDRVAVTGAGNTFTADGTLEILLRGITPPANNAFTPSIGDQFRIVTTEEASGILSNFAAVTQPTSGLSVNTRFDVLYGSNYIDLVLTPESYAVYAAANGNLNARNAMVAFDTIRPAAGIIATGPDPFSGLLGLSGVQLNTAIAQLSGEIHAQSANDVKDQMISLSNMVMGASHVLDPEEMLWVNVNYNRIDYDDDKISTGYDASTASLVVGYDIERQADRRYGLAFGYADSELDSIASSSSDNTLTTFLAYYEGSKETEQFGTLNLYLDTGIGLSSRDISRKVSLSSDTNSHRSSTDELVLFGQARISRLLKEGRNANVTGYSSFRFQGLRGDSYTERGSNDTALSIASGSQVSAQLGLGALVGIITDTNKVNWNIDAGLFVELVEDHETLDRDVSLGTADWEVQGTDVGDVSTKISAHGIWNIRDDMSWFVDFGVVGSSRRLEEQISLGFRIDI
ncbi:MAG: autotransporter-associated beta strand protein [Porticoccus sp.]|jgi:autotransporter-associated beta strand protein